MKPCGPGGKGVEQAQFFDTLKPLYPGADTAISRARYYSPATGTFNQRDTFAGNNYDPQSLHKYAYAHQDPVNGIDPSGNELLSLLVVFSIAAILAVSSTGCGRKPTPKVTAIKAVLASGDVPAYAKGIDWEDAHILGDAKLGNVGPWNDNNANGCVNYVHWFIFEGSGLTEGKVTLERYVYGIDVFGDGTGAKKGEGWQGPGFKVPSNLNKLGDAGDGPPPHEIRYLQNGSVLIVADAPGGTSLPQNNPVPYPYQKAGNFLLQVKYGSKVLAEVWYDVGIKAQGSGPSNVTMNALRVTDSKVY